MGSSNAFGLPELVRGVGGMLGGTLSYPTLATPRVIRRLPRALHAAYSMTRKAKSIGPNLKGVICVALPIGALLIVPLSPVVTALVGTVVGTVRGVQRKNVFKSAWDDTQLIDQKVVDEMIPSMYDYTPRELDEGEEPFDISPLRGLKSLITGISGAAFSLATSGFTLSRRLLPNLHRKTWNSDNNMFEQTMIWSVVSVVWVLTPALGLLGGAVYGLVQGCRFGYTKGLRAAFRHLADDNKKLDQMLKEAIRQA